MNNSSCSDIYLSSASSSSNIEGQVCIWSLRDILNCSDGQPIDPVLHDRVSHSSPISALSWNPSVPGIFATGGSKPHDSVIRLYDLNRLSEETKRNNNIAQQSHDDVVHSIKCNSIVTGLSWRKTNISDRGFGDHELISTHGNPGCEVKLWQINKYKQDYKLQKPLFINGKAVQYWFTKVKDWHIHDD